MKLDFAATRAVPGFTLTVTATFSAPVTGVVGPSGAGKTTLLHLVTGLLRPTTGRIALDGQILVEVDERGRTSTFVPAHRRGIAAVFQDGRLFPHLDVTGNLRYGCDATAQARARERNLPGFDDVVAMLTLAPLLTRRTGQLSGGERQRVALGRALLCAPRLLVLDEPLAALDAALRRQILPFLRRIRDRGVPMLYVAHDPAEVLYLAGALVLLSHGGVRGAGALRDLATRADLAGDLHDLGLDNLLHGTITAADDNHTVITISGAPGGTTIHAPADFGPVGAERTVAISPADISLSLAPITGISIRNQLPATVTAVTTTSGRAQITLDAGIPLRAEISPAAVADLNLIPGAHVHCLFKAQSIRPVDGEA